MLYIVHAAGIPAVRTPARVVGVRSETGDRRHCDQPCLTVSFSVTRPSTAACPRSTSQGQRCPSNPGQLTLTSYIRQSSNKCGAARRGALDRQECQPHRGPPVGVPRNPHEG